MSQQSDERADALGEDRWQWIVRIDDVVLGVFTTEREARELAEEVGGEVEREAA